jgi:tryptophanyl-tRNA synthetase
MSKSFGNAISLAMTADETAALIKRSETDSTREMSYSPDDRPGVSALLSYIALMRGLPIGGEGERLVADEINSDPKYGAGLLKAVATETVNDYLAEHRAKRAELANNLDYIRDVLHKGIENARAEAVKTLQEVQNAMGTVY